MPELAELDSPPWFQAPEVMPPPNRLVLILIDDVPAIAHATPGDFGGWALFSLDLAEGEVSTTVFCSFDEEISWCLLPTINTPTVSSLMGIEKIEKEDHHA